MGTSRQSGLRTKVTRPRKGGKMAEYRGLSLEAQSAVSRPSSRGSGGQIPEPYQLPGVPEGPVAAVQSGSCLSRAYQIIQSPVRRCKYAYR
ncbi:hypothetical protein PoB_000046200 [Plakobranchus ocellatus]|uniref:Uncharacterized protein n=1 Tax=Plakobranchus ocellatus TaxID=259542 RepID=A0AAV3XVT3_9GAST|nr:hypothetical protein PoB_000046200 [Plakobranchus ocellatus]